MEKKRIRKEVFLEEDEEIVIVKKKKTSFVKKMFEELIKKFRIYLFD